MTLRFIHTADLHLDSPFRGLTNIPRDTYAQIYQSTFKAFDQVIEYCIEYKVDFLLISGDIYDIEDRSLKAQIHFLRGLEKLSTHGIHAFIIHGNHDPVDKITTKFHWPDNAHFFSSEQVESFPFFKHGVEVARIHGRSYPTKEFKENIIAEYKGQGQTYQIGLLHSNINGDPLHDTYCPANLTELMQSNIDYWALGHIHKGEILRAADPVIVYPGNTQGRHIKEQGEKECILVEVDNNGKSSITPLSTAEIIFEVLEADVSSAETIDQLFHQLQELIDQRKDTFNKPMILRIYLKGKTKLHTTLVKAGTMEELRELIHSGRKQDKHWTWIEQLNLQTKPHLALEDLVNQNHFLADFIQQLQGVVRGVEQLSLAEIGKELLDNRRIKRHLSKLSEEDIQEIYQHILHLALDHFLEEEIS